MNTASFARHQRLFGQRDWSAGEPYRVGNLQLGVVTPEGAIEMHRRPRCIEQEIEQIGNVVAGIGIAFLISAVACLSLLIDGAL